MNPVKMAPNDARRWRALASSAALRTGDKEWLRKITDDPEHHDNSILLVTITSARMLQDGEYEQARVLLGTLKNPEDLDEIPRRRYLQLNARLEQMNGIPERERIYIAKLVDFAGQWATPTCQSCHADTKRFGQDAIATFSVSDWWVGERFTELIKQSGDAQKVRREAEARLQKNPSDQAAHLRAAYALRALNQPEKAEAHLRALPWAEFPDREPRPSLRTVTFP